MSRSIAILLVLLCFSQPIFGIEKRDPKAANTEEKQQKPKQIDDDGLSAKVAIYVPIGQQGSDAANSENNSRPSGVGLLWWYWDKFIDEPLAVVTLLIFVATLLLWRATRKLVQSSDAMLEAANRPWVNIKFKGGGPIRSDGRQVSVSFKLLIVNAGNTPAADIEYLIEPIEKAIDQGKVFERFVKNQKTRKRTGFSSEFLLGKSHYLFESGVAIDFDGTPDITRGIKLLCIVKYRFTFGKKRFSFGKRTAHYSAKVFQLLDMRKPDEKAADPNYVDSHHVSYGRPDYRVFSD